MNSDWVPLTVDLIGGEPSSEESAPEARVSEAHAERMAVLFREEHAKVVHYLVARTRSWPEARDIAAQAFSQVLGMKDPENVTSLKAYLYSAAKNIATNTQRLGALRGRLNGIAQYELPSTAPPPEPGFSDEQRLELLQRAMDRLRPLWREILRLRFWEDLPYEEIVVRLSRKGIAVSRWTVRRWIEDALAECGEAIRDAEGEG